MRRTALILLPLLALTACAETQADRDAREMREIVKRLEVTGSVERVCASGVVVLSDTEVPLLFTRDPTGRYNMTTALKPEDLCV